MEAVVNVDGDNAARDAAICRSVGEDLERLYPGHMWAVGVGEGYLHIRLIIPTPQRELGGYGFMLHLKNMVDPHWKQRVMRAGGEMLERYGIPRGRSARPDDPLRALEHGLDTDNGVLRSTGSKVGDRW